MKTRLEAKNCLYPMPTVLVGATVNGSPNFMTVAHVGIMDPGNVSLGMSKTHHTNRGIRDLKTFSINVPSTAQVMETDYCGLATGTRVNKAELFDVFYGTLKTAPMITECPINMECRLVKTVDFPQHDVFVGEITSTYVDDSVLTDGIVDYAKVQPILFTMPDQGYWRLGERFAKAWSVGKGLFKS